MFGVCFFRQKRDPSAPRGFVQVTCARFQNVSAGVHCAPMPFVQRSVVLITDLPFIGLFKRVMQLLGPIHFEAGSAVLEAAFLNMNAWCVRVFLCYTLSVSWLMQPECVWRLAPAGPPRGRAPSLSCRY